MTFTPNIPQANDIISQSQLLLLNNFGQLNVKYGTSGDHFAFDNNNADETNRHAKVTLPQLPTPSGTSPGNSVPTPPLSSGVFYVKAALSQSIPYYRKDNTTVDFPALPIRAMGRFLYNGGAVGTSFNLSKTSGDNTNTQTFSFTENMPDANYLILITTGRNTGSTIAPQYIPSSITNVQFDVNVSSLVTEFSIIILHYA